MINPSMKILFDHQMFSLQKYGGVSRYFAGLNKGINALAGYTSKIAVLYSENEYLKDHSPVLNNVLGHQLFLGKPELIYKWNKKISKWYIRLGHYDLLHPTYFDTYFIKYNKKPLVITVHDMIYENLSNLFPDSIQVIAHKKQAIEKADAIIAISEYTKQEIIKFYPEVQACISIVHHGHTFNTALAQTILDLPAKYILFVGERWHYKNFIGFVKSISPLLNDDPELNLICAGGGKFLPEENKLLLDVGIATQCIQLNATDAQLKYLYTHARLFVFPSLQEGFGFPLLEAFANNCPVVCSNNTALPEVAGDAAIYFDPLNADSMKTAVALVLNSTQLQEDLKIKGRQRLPLFTMDRCVQNTLKVYQSVL
jgi:glycosyltransferase involved in cell wall biosynthesis